MLADENNIQLFTTGKENWMISDSTKGAEASATVYTIVETAKVNKLNSY